MSKERDELTDQFDAQSEEGQRFRILVYTTLIDASPMSNPSAAPVKGMKTAITSDGQLCNRIDDDTFEIVELGIQVKRV